MPSVHTAVTASLALVLARIHPLAGALGALYLLAMGAAGLPRRALRPGRPGRYPVLPGRPLAGRAPEATVEPALLGALSRILGLDGVITGPGSLATYEHDGFMARARPLAVCLPTETSRSPP